ncbi:conserved exported hypothetical protein [Rubrivivax sp. A210]|uniref:YncE family protein n=1 Tax=Rubrivivax sp. A210 TaxID=2772301 RepID=UPI00191A9704|nr:hypothetical protein [Rubrivivax sp. A210]CAD5370149.1 conserved exported hypothetical protein [Rubrivivax sp. A210]
MLLLRAHVKALLSVAGLLALVACGGGGGASVEASTAVDNGPRQPQATVVRDDNPTAARMALGPADFLPTGAAGQWVYNRLDDAGQRLGGTRIESTPGRDSLQVVETDEGFAPDSTTYRLDAAGWVLASLANTQLPAGAIAVIGEITQYPSPFHGIGSTRVQFRSGDFGRDLDGDGVNESFEFQFRQTMLGYEAVAGPYGEVEALHIRDELLLTVIPSKRGSANATARVEVDDWLVKGAGLVRERVRSLGADGNDVFPPYTLALASVRIGGADPLDVNAISQIRSLAVTNRDLVYDAARLRYYASVPGSVLGQGNRIAVIDAASGAVNYSAVVGSEPGAMALAADGASLYVALDGSSELLHLALPGLTEIGRVRLPADSIFGPYVTETLAASPVDPRVVAVSLAYTGSSPRHAGVLLVRNLQAMPQRTAGHTGSNVIAFGADGGWLYGLNNETTEFGLRRIEVLADGLAERQVLPSAVPQFYLRSLQRSASGLVLGNRLYAEGSLAPLGQISGAAECWPLAAPKLACITHTFGSDFDLLVADAGRSSLLARLHAPTDNQASRRILVAGPPGQLAVRDRIDHPARNESTRILLLSHPALN